MNGKELSRHLTDLPEEMIAEAMAPAKDAKQKNIATRVLRVAAIAAAFAILITALAFWPADENYVTGPGVLVVRAYAADENGDTPIEGVVLEEGVTFTPKVRYNMQTSYREHFPFEFSVDESLYAGMELTLEINTNAGIFYKNDPYVPNGPGVSWEIQALMNSYGQHFTVGIDKKLYWEPWGFDYAYMQAQVDQGKADLEDPDSVWQWHLFEDNPSFIDVILRADDHIIGYCVIEIREINGMTGFSAEEFSFEVLTIVGFPQVSGKWQDVTLQYVQELIGRIHLERKELS